MVLADRRLLWHPRLDNRFLVGGGTQLTVYEWLPDLSEIKHVASKYDLQMLKVCIPMLHVVDFSPYYWVNMISILIL